MGCERRKLNRFLVNDNAFVAVGARFPKVGRIMDISKGGLSFEYHADYLKDKICSLVWNKGILQADIFVVRNGFSLSNMPCTIIYDVTEYVVTTSLIIKKRCGIQFGEFTDDQERLLRDFLAEQTTGFAARMPTLIC